MLGALWVAIALSAAVVLPLAKEYIQTPRFEELQSISGVLAQPVWIRCKTRGTPSASIKIMADDSSIDGFVRGYQLLCIGNVGADLVEMDVGRPVTAWISKGDLNNGHVPIWQLRYENKIRLGFDQIAQENDAQNKRDEIAFAVISVSGCMLMLAGWIKCRSEAGSGSAL